MNKEIQRAILRACARFIGKKLEPVDARLKKVEGLVAKAMTPEQLEEVRTAWQGELGELKKELVPGLPGKDGKDAEPVVVADVVAELVKSEALAPLIDLMVAEAVAKHFEANPVRDGRDGERGQQGEKGDAGERGADGKDGTGLADALIDRDGALVLTMTDGRAKTLGVVVGKDGDAGTDGRDGLSMVDVSREYDGTTHEVVERWTVGGEAKEIRYPAGGIRPGGFWREGLKCHASQAITHDGALWIARRDTTAKPCLENADDWQLAARKGRDGRDGKDGKPPPGPVKLGDSNA
jgi:hypothetical protein